MLCIEYCRLCTLDNFYTTLCQTTSSPEGVPLKLLSKSPLSPPQDLLHLNPKPLCKSPVSPLKVP